MLLIDKHILNHIVFSRSWRSLPERYTWVWVTMQRILLPELQAVLFSSTLFQTLWQSFYLF